MINQTYRKRANLLATGQTTVYAAGDNGTNQKGIVKAYTILTTGQYAGTTNITLNAKTDAHSNNCVEDNNTRLMWSRYVSASVGPTSNGTLPWTTNVNGEGIFAYAAAANAAGMAGYSDWRVPNKFELESIMDFEQLNALPNSAAFPAFPSAFIISSTTQPNATASGIQISSVSGVSSGNAKTNTNLVLLVRG